MRRFPFHLAKLPNHPCLPGLKRQSRAPSINILSIIPSQGEPGTVVTLYGMGFTADVNVFLGNAGLPAAVTNARQLSFEIPKLNTGLYALYLKRDDGTTSRPYNFNILPLKPVAVFPFRPIPCMHAQPAVTGR